MRLGASRQVEIFVIDSSHAVRYHGRVDDQYQPGSRRAAPSRPDLALALDELLAGAPVSVPQTPVSGCVLDRASDQSSRRAAEQAPLEQLAMIDYEHHIAPLFERHCVECHRPGRIAPFALTSYEAAVAWSETIRERVADGAMPPWHADPAFGHFANERRLSDEEKQRIESWFASGMPRGDKQAELAAKSVPAASPAAWLGLSPEERPSDAWRIGEPDRIISLPEPIAIPAEGVIDYAYVEVDPGFERDVWIRGAEVRPGAVDAVHHSTVFVAPPSGLPGAGAQPPPGAVFLAGYIPGVAARLLPPGMARRVPGGWHLYIQLHYVPTGVATSDQTSVGLVFGESARLAVETQILLRDDFTLAPRLAEQRLEQTWTAPRDMLLLSMMPHMHLRGKTFCYEAIYPSGERETLLSVPRFDLMWQHLYVLADPKPLPAGTIIRAIATYDNSSANRANPDPEATVRCGPQTTDEMFNGWFDVAVVESPDGARPLARAWAALLVVAIWRGQRRLGRGVGRMNRA